MPIEMILQSNFSDRVPQGLCSTVRHTPSSSVQTTCRETASLGNAHRQQQTALKEKKKTRTVHYIPQTHVSPRILHSLSNNSRDNMVHL